MTTGQNVDQLAGVLLRSFRGAQQAANLSGQMAEYLRDGD